MLSGTRLKKLQEWTSRFERFENSGLTVVDFCESEGVSVPSYYHWKKKLRSRSKRKAANSFQSVALVSNPAAVHSATTIQLGDQVRIELGRDEQIVAIVVKQVIDAVVASTPQKGE